MAKCKICGKEIKKTSDMIKVKNRIYVCSEDCKLIYEQQENNKTKSSKPVDNNWTELMSYIDFLYEGECNFPFICSQIKYMKQTYNYTTVGILLTLQYYIETLGLHFDKEYGITHIVTKYYEKAKKNYITMRNIENEFYNFEFGEDKTITIKCMNSKTVNPYKLKDDDF